MIFEIRGILLPKLTQFISSRPATNEGRFITRTKTCNLPISRFKINAYKILPQENMVLRKPFSRRGPYRIGMTKLCQRVKIYEEPLSRYPVYPGVERTPISTYVTNWRWYSEIDKIPERKVLESRIQGVGMDGYLQAKNMSRLEEIQKQREETKHSNSTDRTRRKDLYWD